MNPTVSYTASDPGTQLNLGYLLAQVGKANQLLAARNPPYTMTVNSAYRPLSYQTFLYQLFTLNNQLNSNANLARVLPALKKAQVSAMITQKGSWGRWQSPVPARRTWRASPWTLISRED